VRFIVGLFVLVSALSVSAHELKGSLPDHYPPYSIVGDTTKGIIPDLLVALNSFSDHAYKAQPNTSRRSLKLLHEGQIHYRFDSERWVANASHYYWSDAIVEVNDVLVYPASGPAINDIKQLQRLANDRQKPLRIGTRFDYHYPTLMPLVNNGNMVRDNFYSEINMLKALADKEHGQLSAVVIAEHVYDYLLRSRPELVGELVKSNRPIDTALYQFQFPKTDNGRINMLYTNRLLDKLRRNGELEKIVNNYTQ